MKNQKIVSFFTFILALMLVFSGPAYAKIVKGQLVEMSSVDKSITIQEVATFGDQRYVTYKVSDKAKWHICLKEKCITKIGVEGYRTVNEYAQYGAYGIPHKSYGVVLDVTGELVTGLEVQIITKIH